MALTYLYYHKNITSAKQTAKLVDGIRQLGHTDFSIYFQLGILYSFCLLQK